jgi:hypothetical protein
LVFTLPAADVTQTTFIALLDSTDQDRAHQQVQTRRSLPDPCPSKESGLLSLTAWLAKQEIRALAPST